MTDLASSTNYRTATETRPASPSRPSTVDQPPVTTGTDGPGRGPRWMATVAVAVGAFAVVGTAVVVDTTRSSTPEPASTLVVTGEFTTAQQQIQESIDAALAERVAPVAGGFTTAQDMVQESIDAALAERSSGVQETGVAQRIIQESIDAALAERVAPVAGGFTTAQDMIQESIDAALAGRGQDDSFATAEANRMATLREVLG